ncbi:MAG: hypothetical protein JW943_11010 [Deltaproteobacteria bacterium]|nr:hypothetical protein [Deltaproteobacteria bacterium]
MKKVKITFNITADVAQMLEERVPKRKRNRFIEEAVHARFSIMEEEKRMREMVIANKARDEELELIDNGLELDDAIFEDDDLLCEEEVSELDDYL